MSNKAVLPPHMDARLRRRRNLRKRPATIKYEDAASDVCVGKYVYTGKRGYTDLPRG